ncbi:CG34460 [Drosophila busckii]|uniref:CG34460 n=1 Tax=Drosophila busckii TaxID=30019 RepID=A0A0M4EHM1_DROBS|nr:uncharacterized protein LOC108595852 [Drosophila busckii]ALC42110.1 CG34460 [Drosophila busckii]
MKHLFINLYGSYIILVICCIDADALVHFKALKKGSNGCLDDDGKEMKVYGETQDKNTCGVIVCQNTEGHALIHYCQIPAAFEACNTNGVLTTVDFPECCWKCVKWHNCDAEKKE